MQKLILTLNHLCRGSWSSRGRRFV